MNYFVNFKLKQFNGNPDAAFYIQCKGMHSGKPLLKPIQNCFSVYCDDLNLFFLVLALYKGRRFESIIHGSVIPFIRIKEAKILIQHHLPTLSHDKYHLFKKIITIDMYLKSIDEQKKVCTQMQVLFCNQLLQI